MEGYLGEFPVNIEETEFRDFNAFDWALYFIEAYGQFDGDHHKAWVLDQVARLHKGTPVVIVEARWDNGHSELRVNLGDPSEDYLSWVKDMKDGEDGAETYHYEEGIAP